MKHILPLLLLACTSSPADPPLPDTGPYYASSPDCAAAGDMSGFRRWPYLQNVTPTSAVVLWGTDVDAESTWLEVEGTRYEAEHTDILDLDPPMRLHQARIEGLEPGSATCYGISTASGALGGSWPLRTAPGHEDAHVRFIVIGDFGNNSPAQLALRDAMRERDDDVHLWITAGDNAYGSGTHQEFQDHVFTAYQEFWTDVPVFPTLGNHDYKTDHAQPYLDNFVLPEVAYSEVDQERYYSIDWGVLHFAAIDSQEAMYRTTASIDNDDQFDWLHADLAGSTRIWTAAGWHYPTYSGQPDRTADVFAWARTRLVVEEHGVPLVLNGHNHMYERFGNIHDDQRVTDGLGTTYVVTGGGGAGLYQIGDHPLHSAVASAHHYMLFEATPCTLTGQAIGVDGEVFDSFTLDACAPTAE